MKRGVGGANLPLVASMGGEQGGRKEDRSSDNRGLGEVQCIGVRVREGVHNIGARGRVRVQYIGVWVRGKEYSS